MANNNFVKRAAITLMAALMLTTGAGALAPANVSANDGTGIYAEKDSISVKDLDKTGIVTADCANVREGISTSTRIVNTMQKGTVFHICGQAYRNGKATDWYQVFITDRDYEGKTAAYIKGTTFKFTDTSRKANTSKKAADSQKVKGVSSEEFDNADYTIENGIHMNVTGVKNYLGLRSRKSTSDKYELAQLHNGDEVILLKDCGTYSLVYSEDAGYAGYVVSDYIK